MPRCFIRDVCGRPAAWLFGAVVFLVAFDLRTAGLRRGIDADACAHPDEAKQIAALENYLRGRYAWRTGSLFYDGYPYGLNRVDELLMRPALFARGALSGAAPAAPPDRRALTGWARGLRVLYGLLAMGLGAAAARVLMPECRGARAWTLLLLALAPVSIAVCHHATGDVGTDLFAAAALAALLLWATGRGAAWMPVCGLAVGVAFGCKYNGALAGTAVALLLALELAAGRRLVRVAAAAAAALLGFAAGAVLATPACLVEWTRAWRDVAANFAFIRDYGIADEFRALPARARLARSLAGNLPLVVRAMGAGLTLAAAGGAAAAWARLRGARALRERDPVEAGRRLAAAAVLTYPFLALAASIAGKPVVQPFHFSYLQLPLSLGAAFLACRAGRRPGRAGAAAALALALLVTAEIGRVAWRERFYWSREDNLWFRRHLPSAVLRAQSGKPWKRAKIKDVRLEPDNPAVFRNRGQRVLAWGGAEWRALGQAPVPAVPLPGARDWIFANGPVFPRNDRMLRVAAGGTARREVVVEDPGGAMAIGLRSGARAAEAAIAFGGARAAERLGPDAQRIVRLVPRRWRRVDPGGEGGAIFMAPLRAAAKGGDVWVTVLATPREEAVFRLFGGGEAAPPDGLPGAGTAPEALGELVAGARYLESAGPPYVELAADGAGAAATVTLAEEGLACGAYTLACDVSAGDGGVELRAVLEDAGGRGAAAEARGAAAPAGPATLRFGLVKGFAPYQCALRLVCEAGACRVLAWRFDPDAARMARDIAAWRQTGARPEWAPAQ